MGSLGLIIILIYNIILMLLITLVIASLTLIERKFLSLVQRRVGPNYVGYKGRLQYIADALKLFVKGVVIPYESNKFWFVFIPSFALAICYSFWINSVWGPGLSLFDIEYNTVYATLLSIIFSFCIILTGYFSRNKYAMLASIRTVLLVLNLEIFLGLLILNLVLITESFNFTTFVLFQETVWFIYLYFGLTGVIIITFLLEVNRAPFDLAEAESELITGYSTELGGFHFGLYYLGEYFHLFFFSMTIVIFFLGGWELPNFNILLLYNFIIF
jgi:NADH-quinone oxidoreductase subunit H